MTLSISTPAVLFTTICLLLSAYIARFTIMYKLIRNFQQRLLEEEMAKGNDKAINLESSGLPLHKIRIEDNNTAKQIRIFRKRLSIIKYVHLLGVLSLFFSTLSMLLVLAARNITASYSFFIALLLFISAIISVLIDIYYSTKAVDIRLDI